MTEIDRLIEDGLARYGKGELDAAIEVWERVLQIDPENAQASSYVDYVRLNYELLIDGQGPTASTDGAPFIGDDDYKVEIVPGEILPAPIAMPIYDAIDEGWALDDEVPVTPGGSRTISFDPPQVTLELDADLPSDWIDDATREYSKGRPPTRDLALVSEVAEVAEAAVGGDDVNEFAPQLTPGFGAPHDRATPGFGSPSDAQTPAGFGQQLTGVRKRDLGFVRPATHATVQNPKGNTIPGMTPLIPIAPARAQRGSVLPELKMTLRTPEIHEDAEITIDRGIHNTNAFDLPDDPPTAPRTPLVMDDMARLDLISSLPTPTASRTKSSVERAITDAEPDISFETEPEPEPESAAPVARAPALEVVPFASPISAPPEPEPELDYMFGSDVETKDLPAGAMREIALELGLSGRADGRPQEPDTRASTRELPRAERLPARASQPPLISQPTRDLGIRPVRLPTEEESTAQLEVPRSPVVRSSRSMRPTQAPEVAPTDRIDATSQLILDAVDRNAPVDELRDDRTRRRIQGLIERAGEWVVSGEPEKAVAAIDLVLAEDSTSPLAQKLVHRNQNAIMGVFQTYLGDLQRQPTLARPLHELAAAPISPRAAFLLSRIDGMLSLDEILDVSGMPRLEAYRYLCQLFLRGILK